MTALELMSQCKLLEVTLCVLGAEPFECTEGLDGGLCETCKRGITKAYICRKYGFAVDVLSTAPRPFRFYAAHQRSRCFKSESAVLSAIKSHIQ